METKVPAGKWFSATHEKKMTHWIEGRDSWSTGLRYTRPDGAVVKYQMGPRKLDWIAFEPNPSENYLGRQNRRGLIWPRRWGSAEAAMRAVDREYPLNQQSSKGKSDV